LPTLLTYTLIAEAFAEQMEARTGIDDLIWDGTITTRFQQPLPLIGIVTAELFGKWHDGFWTMTLPLLAAAPFLGISPLPTHGLIGGLLFALSLVLAIVVGLALDLIFSAILIVFGANIWLLSSLRSAVATLLTGAFLPFALMPFGLGEIFQWLPFAAMASAPLQIFTGTGNAAILLGLQAFWAAALVGLGAIVWNYARERIVSQGG
jgi:ABC-2 type transport system permease protein